DLSWPHCHHIQTSLFLRYSFFIHMPRLSIPTLFPYTTLFRSTIRLSAIGLVYTPLGETQSIGPDLQGNASCKLMHIRTHSRLSLDRKSTRLNSSHRTISYAVFCLKKKKLQFERESDKQELVHV